MSISSADMPITSANITCSAVSRSSDAVAASILSSEPSGYSAPNPGE